MIILGIETSCDETAAAVAEATGEKSSPFFKALSNVIHSQIDIHKEYGGVFPTLAKREHIRKLPEVVNEAMRSDIPKIDAIAVTVGPGLPPALWTGINFAKELSIKLKKPIIPVNHLEGHLVSVLLPNPKFKCQMSNVKVRMPAVGLIVSGGHTELIIIKEWGDYEIIGSTRDDAAGEAFDKVARILGLPYPGGPALSALAEKFQNPNVKCQIKLPRPMINSKDFDFSFSGLKTAVLYFTITNPEYLFEEEEKRSALAREFEQAVVDVIITKTRKAIEKYNVKSFVAGGGVVANKKLRQALETLAEDLSISLFLPARAYTGDNAAMIAAAAYLHAPVPAEFIEANGTAKL